MALVYILSITLPCCLISFFVESCRGREAGTHGQGERTPGLGHKLQTESTTQKRLTHKEENAGRYWEVHFGAAGACVGWGPTFPFMFLSHYRPWPVSHQFYLIDLSSAIHLYLSCFLCSFLGGKCIIRTFPSLSFCQGLNEELAAKKEEVSEAIKTTQIFLAKHNNKWVEKITWIWKVGLVQACKADSGIIFNETLADRQIVQVICIFTGNLLILTFFWERNYVKGTLTIYLSRITLQKHNGIRSSLDMDHFWPGKRKSWKMSPRRSWWRRGPEGFRPLHS